MELNLCGSKCCPRVISKGNTVEIGEQGNLVKLKKAEWNTLVDAVKEGKIDKI